MNKHYRLVMDATLTGCRLCQHPGAPVVIGTPVCAVCLDAGAWVQLTCEIEERRPGQWWAVMTKRCSPAKATRYVSGPHDREQALEIAASEARLEAARYSGDWLVEIVELRAKAAAPARAPITGDGYEIVEDRDANRVQIRFTARQTPAACKVLKGWGFRWAPSVEALQRQASNGAWHAAQRAVAAIGGAGAVPDDRCLEM
jgi:hypothetical protein